MGGWSNSRRGVGAEAEAPSQQGFVRRRKDSKRNLRNTGPHEKLVHTQPRVHAARCRIVANIQRCLQRRPI